MRSFCGSSTGLWTGSGVLRDRPKPLVKALSKILPSGEEGDEGWALVKELLGLDFLDFFGGFDLLRPLSKLSPESMLLVVTIARGAESLA